MSKLVYGMGISYNTRAYQQIIWISVISERSVRDFKACRTPQDSQTLLPETSEEIEEEKNSLVWLAEELSLLEMRVQASQTIS